MEDSTNGLKMVNTVQYSNYSKRGQYLGMQPMVLDSTSKFT